MRRVLSEVCDPQAFTVDADSGYESIGEDTSIIFYSELESGMESIHSQLYFQYCPADNQEYALSWLSSDRYVVPVSMPNYYTDGFMMLLSWHVKNGGMSG